MKKILDIKRKERLVVATTDIVYAQRKYWCDSGIHPLKLSIIKPRTFFEYDSKEKLPVIIWLCGGGFTEVDKNVWIPELTYFVKHGFAVVSVEYSTFARTRFPQPIIDIKEAIRFIRANADEFMLDAERIAVMGESAGGYLSSIIAVTNGHSEFDTGNYLSFSSAVQAAVPWYPPVDVSTTISNEVLKGALPVDMEDYTDPRVYIKQNTPPFLILHGLKDTQVDYHNSELLYDALQKNGVYSELYLIKDAEHTDLQFIQPEVKQLMVDFLNKKLLGKEG